jgi:hypothetical protein
VVKTSMSAARTATAGLFRSVVSVLSVLVLSSSAYAEGEAAAPTPDAIFDQLLKTDPAAMRAALDAMKAKADALAAESAAIRTQQAEAEAKVEALRKTLGPIEALMPKPEAAPSAMAAAPGTEATPAMATEPKLTFTKDIFPIFEQKCLSCHEEGKRRGGLSLATFNHTMEGGSSGQVISPGDPDASRLVKLISLEMEPIMPPKGEALDDATIDLIRAWIAEGAPRDPGSKIMLAKASAPKAPQEIFVAASLDGPPPMPEVALAAAAAPLPRAVVARALAASPTAPLVAVAGDRQALIYNLDTMALMGALPFPEGDIFSLTFSFNGQLLLAAGGQEGSAASAVVWDIRKGERIGTYGRGYDTILAGDISPDHRMIALGGPDRKARVYSTADGSLLYECGQHTDWVMSVKFSPDGELLSTGDRGGNLFLWQAANGRPVESLRGHTGSVNELAYTLDSTILASAGGEGKVFLWDTWKYSAIRNFNAHSGAAFSVDISKTNEIVTSGVDGLTKRFDMNGKEIGKFESVGDWAYQTAFGKAGAVVVTGAWTGNVAVWNLADAARLATLTTNPAPAAPVQVAAAPAPSDSAGAP